MYETNKYEIYDDINLYTNQYRIDEVAGHGGFGDVYRGYDRRMDRPVAIKCVSGVDEIEAGILKKLDHIGLPRLYDIIRVRNKTYMIMEWIDGIDLEKYIENNGAMPERRAEEIGRELLEILRFLHNQTPAIVYQDLKPANIMLKPDGHIKLIDFGTAVLMKYGDETNRAAGTGGYCSPQQKGLCGRQHIGIETDIYSWGAVMYSMLSGCMLNKPPYTMQKIGKICPQLTRGLERVISKAVERETKDRYANVSEVFNAMDRRYITDMMYKTIHTLITAILAIPLIFAWFYAYKEGLFGYISQLFESAVLTIHKIAELKYQLPLGEILSIFAEKIKIALFTVRADNVTALSSYGRSAGLLLICISFFIGGLRILGGRKYIQIRRSVYLSERRFSGLWMGVLAAGIIFGYSMSGLLPATVSYAAESEITDINNDILPVHMLDEKGNKALVRYETIIRADNGIKLEIEPDVVESAGLQELTLILNQPGKKQKLSRTFYLE